MKWLLNILLIPLSVLYSIASIIRNRLYDEHICKSHSVDVPTIGVGNLAVGGTGKTPMVEYLVRMLSQHYHVAVLSRGYGRQGNRFVMATEEASARTIGDEMMQMHTKFPKVPMAVCANRYKGIRQLLLLHPEIEVVVLDDAFQHRALNCNFHILLTPYDKLYIHDHMLPWGRLREPATEARRAQTVIVTKCPESMKPIDCRVVSNKLKLHAGQQLFFSYIDYKPIEVTGKPLLLTGIAHSEYLQQHIEETYGQVEVMAYPDHHRFSKRDIKQIAKRAERFGTVLTTEKDWVRLQLMELPETLKAKMKVVPIQMNLRDDAPEFERIIKAILTEQLHKWKGHKK